MTRVVTDSREIQAGDLFIARSGQKVDARKFLSQAFSQGAAAAIVSRIRGDEDRSWPGPVILVDDATQALGRLAAAYRQTLRAKVVCITGSVGKTTTKDMLAAALEDSRKVVRAPKSFNNEVGVPLTLLAADRSTQVVIVETGTNGPGEIEALARIAQPDVAVITAVGYSHLEGLGSLEGIAREKASLLQHLSPKGFAVFNGDDIRVRGMAAAVKHRNGAEAALTVGLNPGNTVEGQVLSLMSVEQGSFSRMRVNGGRELSLHCPGEHMLRCALFAFTVATELGVSARAAAAGLAKFRPSVGRLDARRLDTWTILDDCYNANPTSMRAAIETLTLFAQERQRVAVLGSMLELGPRSKELHKSIGRLLARYGVHALITVGAEARTIAQEAVRLGLDETRVASFMSPDDAAECPLLRGAAPGATILFKGSNAVGLDRVIAGLGRRSFNLAVA